MELDESYFVTNVIGTKKVWEPIKAELKDKSGAIMDADCTWQFVTDGSLISVDQFVQETFTPNIEHLGQK